MYCQKCGQEIQEDAIKCANCGELVVRRHIYIEWILYVLAMIPLISSIVVWQWIIRVKAWGRFSQTHPKIHLTIIISSAISVGLVFWAGLSQLLSFIPQSWGIRGGSGEFTPLSITVSIIAGVIAAITHLYVLGKIKMLAKLTQSTKSVEASSQGGLKGKLKAFSRSISKVTASEETADAKVQTESKTQEKTEESPSDEVGEE